MAEAAPSRTRGQSRPRRRLSTVREHYRRPMRSTRSGVSARDLAAGTASLGDLFSGIPGLTKAWQHGHELPLYRRKQLIGWRVRISIGGSGTIANDKMNRRTRTAARPCPRDGYTRSRGRVSLYGGQVAWLGCSAIGRSLASGRAFGPSPTISVSQAKYRSQNIAISIAEVTRTADRTAAAAPPSWRSPNLREAVRDKAECLDCRSISPSRGCGCAEPHKRKGEPYAPRAQSIMTSRRGVWA